MENRTSKILILGLGNDILMDDGIGPKLSREMQKKYTDPRFCYDTAAIGGMELIEMIRDYERVIIIDAIHTKGGIPGAVYHLTPSDFKETSNMSNVHDINFLTALKLAEKLGISVTSKIDIIAVEIIEDLTFGTEFTPPVQEKYPEVIIQVKQIVSDLISGN
jgi:hydrogenase maturation protease